MAASLFTVGIKTISFSYNNLTLCKRRPLSSDVEAVKLCRNKNKNSVIRLFHLSVFAGIICWC